MINLCIKVLDKNVNNIFGSNKLTEKEKEEKAKLIY